MPVWEAGISNCLVLPSGASIGDKVWQDTNGNGVQDAGEPGVNGVVVILKQGATSITTTTTNAKGNYVFTNVAPGTYTVVFQKPSGYSFTATAQGAGGSKVTDVASGSTSAFTVATGQSMMDIDAGLYQGMVL